MATWPSRTWQVGELVTADMFNTIRDQLNELHAQVRPNDGLWTDIPFNPANFGHPAGTWTINTAQLLINRYTQIGNRVIWSMYINDSTISADASVLWLGNPVPPAPDTVPSFSHASYTVNKGVSMVNARLQIHPGNVGASDVLPNAGTNWLAGQLILAFTYEYEALNL